MNAVRLQEILSQRYNTHWTGLRNKITTRSKPGSICSYCNHLSSRPVGQTMQKTLKAKIQNAINFTSYHDAESPALFVGGRRRNRKKRKNKNGQPGKRKARKGGAPEAPVTVPPATPDSAYEELVPIYSVKRPVVSCLDIREPVFYEPVMSSKSVVSSKSRTEEENDSVYSSNDSLVSLTSEHDSGTEQENNTQDDETTEEELNANKGGFPRTHSHDSGVYDDDDSTDDAGYSKESQDELEGAITGDAFETNYATDESFVEVFKDDEQVIESEETTQATEHYENDPDKFDEIDLDDEATEKAEKAVEDHDAAVEAGEATTVMLDCDSIENIKEVKNITEAISLVKFVSSEEEDDIIFDLSLLEVNNTQGEFSKIPTSDAKIQLSEVLDIPTDLEEDVPIRVPMDLLIDDDDHDEVLFEAAARKKDLCITCNPLYEHTLREEEERLSIKSYQSGFTTDFDNINLIRIPVTASNKTTVKSLQESSPLIQQRKRPWRDEDGELACCVIL